MRVPHRLEKGTSASEDAGPWRGVDCEIPQSHISWKENRTPFIMVWKPSPRLRILKTLGGLPKGKAQRGQYVLAVAWTVTHIVRSHISWGEERLWDPISVAWENETFFVRVWKPLPSKRVLKTLRGSSKGKAQRGQHLLAVSLDRYTYEGLMFFKALTMYSIFCSIHFDNQLLSGNNYLMGPLCCIFCKRTTKDLDHTLLV